MKHFIQNHSAVTLLLATSLTAWAQPIITNQPQDQTACVGAMGTLTVQATGIEPLSCQWQQALDMVHFLDRPEATNCALVIRNVQASDSANYREPIISRDQAFDRVRGLRRLAY